MKSKTVLSSVLALFTASEGALAASPGALLWTYELGSSASPAVGLDGTIYVAAEALYALTNAGAAASNVWTAPVQGISHIAVGGDGTIYCGSYYGLYAVAPGGSIKWSWPLSAAAPAINFDQTIYFQSAEYLYALAPSGELKWRSALSFSGTYSAPTIAPDGTIYIGSEDEPLLFAFNPDGSRKWTRELRGTPIGDTPALGYDGTVYITAGDLYAFTPEGNNLWHIPEFWDRSPVLGADGTMYIQLSSWAYQLCLVTPSGIATLTGATEMIRYASPKCAAIDAAGIIWFCASNTVWALSAEGQVLPCSQVIDEYYWAPYTSPVIGPDGTLYSARGGRLYAIATGTNGAAKSSWPMYRGNAQHTGRIEIPVLQQPRKRSDGNFELRVYGRIGKEYSLESSTDLRTWSGASLFLATNVPMNIVDPTPTNSSARFYRVAEK